MCLLVNEKRGGGKMIESPILSVKNLKTYFDVTKGVFAKKQIVKDCYHTNLANE